MGVLELIYYLNTAFAAAGLLLMPNAASPVHFFAPYPTNRTRIKINSSSENILYDKN